VTFERPVSGCVSVVELCRVHKAETLGVSFTHMFGQNFADIRPDHEKQTAESTKVLRSVSWRSNEDSDIFLLYRINFRNSLNASILAWHVRNSRQSDARRLIQRID
jgi:hypothetical protein